MGRATSEAGVRLNHLAQITFDHMWLILFGEENVIDLDYSVKLLEQLSSTLASFTAAEKEALAQVAQEAKNRLLAEPDEFGYTPRALVTDEQRRFLDGVISGEIYNDRWWDG
jgi:hypothetical protein